MDWAWCGALWPGGGRRSALEQLRANQQLIRGTLRQIDREQRKLAARELAVDREMRTYVQRGRQEAARIQAEEIVRMHSNSDALLKMAAELHKVSEQLTRLSTSASMTQAMRGATRALLRLNRSIDLPEMGEIMTKWQRESARMDTKHDMLMDGVEDDEQEKEVTAEAADAILARAVDEIGVESPIQQAPAMMLVEEGEPEIDHAGELERRFAELRMNR